MDKVDYTRYFAEICNKTNAKTRETAYELDIDIEGTMGLSESEKIKYLSIYMPEEDYILFRIGSIWDNEDMIEEHSLGSLDEDELKYIYDEFEITRYRRDELVDYDELTDDEIFKWCANKSLWEIGSMNNPDIKHQAMRYYFSRLLMNYPEEEPLRETIKVSDEVTIIALSQTPCEGYINVMLEGSPEWNDIDIPNNEEQYKVLKVLEGKD